MGAELLAIPAVGAEHADFITAMMAHDPAHRPSARDVEPFCWRSLRSLDGPRLREWSEAVVPPLVSARPSVGGPFESGAILSEASLLLDTPSPEDDGDSGEGALLPPDPTQIPLQPGDELTADPPGAETCFLGPEPPDAEAAPEPVDDDEGRREGTVPSWRSRGPALSGLAMLAVATAVFGVTSFVAAPNPSRPAGDADDRSRTVPTALEPSQPAQLPVEDERPGTGDGSEHAGDVVERDDDAPERVGGSQAISSPGEASVREPVAVVTHPEPVGERSGGRAPAPASRPEPGTGVSPGAAAARIGTVQLSGDTDGVVLVGEAGRLPPGSLPLGDYSLVLPSPDGDVELGRVRVTEGAPIRVSCSFAFRRCQVMVGAH